MLRITSDDGMTKTLVGVEKGLSEVENLGPRIWAHSHPYQMHVISSFEVPFTREGNRSILQHTTHGSIT